MQREDSPDADPRLPRETPRGNQSLPPTNADWSSGSTQPLNDEWRPTRNSGARQRLAARRTTNRLAPPRDLLPWIQRGGWCWLALGVGLLLLLLIASSLLSSLGGSTATTGDARATSANAADTLPVRPTVTVGPTQPPAPPPAAAFTVVNTAEQGLFLRPEPNANNAPLKTLPDGTHLEALGEEAEGDGRTWVKVRDPEGTEGWVAKEFIAPAP